MAKVVIVLSNAVVFTNFVFFHMRLPNSKDCFLEELHKKSVSLVLFRLKSIFWVLFQTNESEKESNTFFRTTLPKSDFSRENDQKRKNSSKL